MGEPGYDEGLQGRVQAEAGEAKGADHEGQEEPGARWAHWTRESLWKSESERNVAWR